MAGSTSTSIKICVYLHNGAASVSWMRNFLSEEFLGWKISWGKFEICTVDILLCASFSHRGIAPKGCCCWWWQPPLLSFANSQNFTFIENQWWGFLGAIFYWVNIFLIEWTFFSSFINSQKFTFIGNQWWGLLGAISSALLLGEHFIVGEHF